MANQPESVGLFPDEIVLLLQNCLGHVSEDAQELDLVEEMAVQFEEIPGIDLNNHTGRISYSIAWCPECERNVTGKIIRPPIGQCPHCKNSDLEDPHEVFTKLDKKKRIILWDDVKKGLKGKRTPMITRKIRRIAEALGKKEEFLALTAPVETKEKENAGPDAAPAAQA